MNKNTLGNLIGAAILVAYVGISYLLYDPSKKEISSINSSINSNDEILESTDDTASKIFNNSSDSIFLLWVSDKEFESGLMSTAFLIDTIPGMLGSGSLITPLYNIMNEKDEPYKYLFAINIKDDFTKYSNWHELKGGKIKMFPFMKLKGGVTIANLTFKNNNKFETLPYVVSQSEYKPTIGEGFYFIGNAGGHTGVIIMMTFLRADKNAYIFQGSVRGGGAGAPIFNDRGEVIAMVVSYDEEKQEVYALPSFLF